MKKDYIKDINNAERRFFNSDLEVRAEGESRKVVGYAAVFNADSEDLGGFVERIAPGAFDKVLDNDTVALFNHDMNYVLARNGKTLKISVDETGLRYEFDAPNTTAGNDLIENLRLGNVNKSSFAFRISIDGDQWEEIDGKQIRTITKVEQLYDVSPVTYPAYPDTTVAQRSKPQPEKVTTYKKQAKRLKLNLLRK